MATPLEGRSYVVTGAGRGIGAAVAKYIAELGGNVIVNDPGVNTDGSGSDAGPAQSVVDEITAAGGTAQANLGSVATSEGAEGMIKQALDAWGSLDGIVHVAGILRDRMVFNMTEEEWDAVIGVHLTGFFNILQPASVLFRQQRHGRIVGFSSSSGLTGNTGQANYGAAKAGIVGGIRCAAKDLGRYGVTVNGIAPFAATRMNEGLAEMRAARAGTTVDQSPSIVNTLRDTRYIAPMVGYLLTDQAWNVNGKIFYVGGGTISLAHEETPYRTIAKQGRWEVDELRALVPNQLMQGIRNPGPPADDLDLPQRPVAAAS